MLIISIVLCFALSNTTHLFSIFQIKINTESMQMSPNESFLLSIGFDILMFLDQFSCSYQFHCQLNPTLLYSVKIHDLYHLLVFYSIGQATEFCTYPLCHPPIKKNVPDSFFFLSFVFSIHFFISLLHKTWIPQVRTSFHTLQTK